MRTYRLADESRPPAARRITDVAIMRHEDLYEVDPRLMEEHVAQQPFPNWDTLRIAAGRHDHLAWMHRHWCTTVVSGERLLAEVERNG
jgi:hypothetical protein